MSTIVFLVRLYYPHVGGVERHVYYLSKELLKRGHDVAVVTTQHENDIPLDEVLDGVRVYRIPHEQAGEKSGTWQWMLKQKKLFGDADVIHAHDVFWWYAPLLYRYPRKRVHTTFHGYEGIGPPRLRAKLHRKLVEVLSRRTICVGDFMRQWYWARPDKVIYGAADMKPAKTVNNGKAVYAGRLADDAGILAYLKCVAISNKVQHLDIYGDGPLRKEVEKHIKKHKISARVHGWVEDVSAVYDAAEYAFVSRYLSIIEAMQVGRLVVAQHNNAIKRDYLKCHPMAEQMVVGRSGQQLADALTRVSDTKQAGMIKTGQTWARKQTWESIADIYETLWQ